MDSRLLLRCLNLQRGIDALGSTDLFLRQYSSLVGADKALSANYLAKLLTGKVPIRDHLAREIEQALRQPAQWLDSPQAAAAATRPFDSWPGAVDGAAYQGLSVQQQAQLQQDAEALVEQWSVTDWRHIRVTTPDK